MEGLSEILQVLVMRLSKLLESDFLPAGQTRHDVRELGAAGRCGPRR